MDQCGHGGYHEDTSIVNEAYGHGGLACGHSGLANSVWTWFSVWIDHPHAKPCPHAKPPCPHAKRPCPYASFTIDGSTR